MKKNRLSFSSVSIENKKPVRSAIVKVKEGNKNEKIKKKIKSSTYQYSKKNYRRPKNNNRPFNNKNEHKVPPPEAGVIRIIPLGGVEEVGKNMTAIEIDNDIIIVDAGMHFSNEETPGIDYIIPNTTYLEKNKEKIRALIITHGHLDHIGGVPLVLSRIGNPPVYSRNLSMLLMRKRQAEFLLLKKMM